MARPRKFGLDYFPFDVNFFGDTKIRRLRAKYGNDGVMIFIILLCKIYENGFYIAYDEDIVLDIADELNVSENFTMQVFAYLFSRSLLDNKLAVSVKVLTSCAIQRRFQEIKAKCRCTEMFVDPEMWLLEKEETLGFIKVRSPEINSEKTIINSEKTIINYGENDTKERKLKERKLKERKLKERKESCADKPHSPSPSDRICDMFNSLCCQMPTVTSLGAKRSAKIQLLLSEYDINDIEKAFRLAGQSSFLNGRNDRGWKACFDWIINADNFRKVLEGNYNDREQTESSFDLSDIMGLANNFGDIGG